MPPLKDYLLYVPEAAIPKALEGAASSIYDQHLQLLKGLHEVPKEHQASILEQLSILQEDAINILSLGLIKGTAANKLEIVSRLNVCRELTIQRLGKKDAAKAKQMNFND